MSELLHLIGSAAYNLDHSANPAVPKYTGAPTADNIDPEGVVVTSMGRDILGNRVCLFTVSPDRQLLGE